MQTLKQALRLARTGQSRALARALHYLDGCPVGGWPETRQAISRIGEELPLRADRTYTVEDWIEAAYTVDATDRYRTCDVTEGR